MKNATEYYFAGFWKRFAAGLIDFFILMPLALLFFIPIEPAEIGEIVISVICSIIGMLYFVLSNSSAKQGTYGKQIMKLKIIDGNGNRITEISALKRWFVLAVFGIILEIAHYASSKETVISVIAVSSLVFAFVNACMVSFNKRKRGIHDFFAKTYVIDTSPRMPFSIE